MSIDKVVLEKIRQKLKENNQSEELTIEIINLLNMLYYTKNFS